MQRREFIVTYFKAKSYNDAKNQILKSKSVPDYVKKKLNVLFSYKMEKGIDKSNNPFICYTDGKKSDVALFKDPKENLYALHLLDDELPFNSLELISGNLKLPNVISPPICGKTIPEYDKELIKYDVECTYNYDKRGNLISYSNGIDESCATDNRDVVAITSHTHPSWYHDAKAYLGVLRRIKIGAPASKNDLKFFDSNNSKQLRIIYKNGVVMIINKTSNYSPKSFKQMTDEADKIYYKIELAHNDRMNAHRNEITVKNHTLFITKIFNQVSAVFEKYGLKVSYRLPNGKIVRKMRPEHCLSM